METANKTPLWLELKKEYIDDNFDKLLLYLKENEGKVKDAFYEKTIELLHQRVQDLIVCLSERAIFEDENDRSGVIFNIRLLASYLLVAPEGEYSLPAFVALANELQALTPKFSEQLCKITMKRLTFESISSLGIRWSDITEFKPELFAHRIFSNTFFTKPLNKSLVFENHGAAFLSSNGIFLTYENSEDGKTLLKSGANSIETGIGCALRTASALKLKKSDDNNLIAMDRYVKDFITSQSKMAKPKIKKRLAEYEVGDTAIVRISKIAYDGTIHVETMDGNYQKMVGVIKYEKPSIVYYYTSSLYEYFREGDYLEVTVTSISQNTFSFEKQLVEFFVNDTRDNYGLEKDMLAKLIDIKPRYCGWINERGVAVYTDNDSRYSKGDLAILRVKQYNKGTHLGKIDAEIVDDANEDDELNEKEIRRYCIRDFAESTPLPANRMEENGQAFLNPMVLKLLFRLFFIHQKKLMKPSDRFRYIANAWVMAELVGDELSSSYIKFAATYLCTLVQFVQNENLSSVQLEPEKEYESAQQTLIRTKVVELLKEYGKKENSHVLAQAIDQFKDSIPMLSRLARLIQTANSMQGTLSNSTINVIKREIIKTLSLETENDTDLEADSGNYLGVESGTIEFKTSMVYPANNGMQPNQTKQTANVFRAVCAFLNSQTGGTVYLGVSDQGYVIGLENDLRFLHCASLETYARIYVQDPIIKQLGLDSMTYIKTERLYEDKVLAIHIAPHPYRVVELNGVAYLRVNAESREMPENVKQEMIARKVFKDKNKAAAISQLQHAMSQRKCAILHGYSSSNSGNVADRLVEPYDVLPEDGLVICFDRKKLDKRVFSISRIGYVEILEEDWKYSASHTPIAVDAFHMSGEKAIKVSLQLDLLAKNLLIEEFPRTKKDISPDAKDENVWYLSTEVYALEGVGRFYIGLANHIKILDAPKLQEYINDFKDKYL